MQSLRQYVIGIIAAAIAVAMMEKLTENAQTRKMIKLVSGLFLSVVLLSPLRNISISSYTAYFDTVQRDAQDTVTRGEGIYRDNLNTIITERCESYILDKAYQLGAEINVHIQCDTSDIPIPVYAEISGNVSPYVRKTLQNMIADDIGIPEEKQLWV